MMLPVPSIAEIAVRFPADWIAVKRQGLPMPRPGLAITYWGLVGLLHFRRGSLDPSHCLWGQVRTVIDQLIQASTLVPIPGVCSPPTSLHELSFNFDFPGPEFFFLQSAGFLYSGRYQKAYSLDYRVHRRDKIALGADKDPKIQCPIRQVQDSFITWGRIGHVDPTLGPNAYRLQLRFSGDCAHFATIEGLRGSIYEVLDRLAVPLGIRLSQVSTPQLLQFNNDLVSIVHPTFLRVLQEGGWFRTGRHISRRLRK